MRTKFSTRLVDLCIEGTSLDSDTGDNLIRGNLSINSDEAKCVVKCFFNKAGFVNNDNEPQIGFITDSLVDLVPLKVETLEWIVKKCFKIKSEYDCETSFQVSQVKNKFLLTCPEKSFLQDFRVSPESNRQAG